MYFFCKNNPRKTIAKSSNVTANPSQTHCNSAQCNEYAKQMRIDWDINKTIWQLNCEKIKLSDIRTTVARHSHEGLTTVVGHSHECHRTVVRLSQNVSRLLCECHNIIPYTCMSWVTGRFGPESFRSSVVSALCRFGPGRFGLSRFGPESFRPLLVGRFGLIFSNPRLVT